MQLLVQLLLHQKYSKKDDYYIDHFHCVRLLLLVLDYNEQLLDYLEQVRNLLSDLEFLNHFHSFNLPSGSAYTR